jgi:arylformamidase
MHDVSSGDHTSGFGKGSMKLYRDFTSQEEIDSEYNIENLVPDRLALIDHMATESARARRDLDGSLDVAFGPTRDETMDIFPAARPGAPVLVFIHGGYWRSFSSKEFSLVAAGPVARGMTVAVMNYSLCPKVSISEITRQSRAVVAWLYRQARQFNGNPERIFDCGHSAGGQQVGMLAATDWPGDYGLPPDVVKGGIPISGIFDLSPLAYSWLQPKLALTYEIIRRESPLLNIPPAGPPLLIVLGENESIEFHRQAAVYLDTWKSNGLEAELRVQPGKNHITVIEDLARPDSPLCQALVEFIAACQGT